jgi:hypothetical protein
VTSHSNISVAASVLYAASHERESATCVRCRTRKYVRFELLTELCTQPASALGDLSDFASYVWTYAPDCVGLIGCHPSCITCSVYIADIPRVRRFLCRPLNRKVEPAQVSPSSQVCDCSRQVSSPLLSIFTRSSHIRLLNLNAYTVHKGRSY